MGGVGLGEIHLGPLPLDGAHPCACDGTRQRSFDMTKKHAVETTLINKAPCGKQLTLGASFDAKPNRRLFLGIWPTPPAVDSMKLLMQGLRHDGIMPGRPVDADRLHLTLFHLGDYVDQMPPGLVPAARAAAAKVRFAPFETIFDRAGGTRGQFLLRATDELADLRSFRTALGSALIEAGLRRHIGGSFTPHVTLSYDFSDAPETGVEPIGWAVREFHLVESLLGKHRHIRLDSWILES